MSKTSPLYAKMLPLIVSLLLVLVIAIDAAYLGSNKQWSLVTEPGLSEGPKQYLVRYTFPGRSIDIETRASKTLVCIGGRLVKTNATSTSIECGQLCSGYVLLETNESKPFRTLMIIRSRAISKTAVIAANTLLAPTIIALILHTRRQEEKKHTNP